MLCNLAQHSENRRVHNQLLPNNDDCGFQTRLCSAACGTWLNGDLDGGDLRRIAPASQDECWNKHCMNTAYCNAVAYKPDQSICFLKSIAENWVLGRGAVKSYRACEPGAHPSCARCCCLLVIYVTVPSLNVCASDRGDTSVIRASSGPLYPAPIYGVQLYTASSSHMPHQLVKLVAYALGALE
jgi:hypothetical protein